MFRSFCILFLSSCMGFKEVFLVYLWCRSSKVCLVKALLYFKMVVILLFPETKMADVGKLISLGKLLVRKVTWLVHTTTSATLILARAFGAECMTRIAYIYSRLPRTHSLHFDFQRQHTLSLSLFHIFTYRDSSLSLSLPIATYRDNTLSFTFSLTETAHTHTHTHTPSLLYFNFQQSIRRKCIHSATFFFLVLPFRLDFSSLAHNLRNFVKPRKR